MSQDHGETTELGVLLLLNARHSFGSALFVRRPGTGRRKFVPVRSHLDSGVEPPRITSGNLDLKSVMPLPESVSSKIRTNHRVVEKIVKKTIKSFQPQSGDATASNAAAVVKAPHKRPPAAHGPCDHCGAIKSPQWRKGPSHKPLLCNACGTKFSRTKNLPAVPFLQPSSKGGLWSFAEGSEALSVVGSDSGAACGQPDSLKRRAHGSAAQRLVIKHLKCEEDVAASSASGTDDSTISSWGNAKFGDYEAQACSSQRLGSPSYVNPPGTITLSRCRSRGPSWTFTHTLTVPRWSGKPDTSSPASTLSAGTPLKAQAAVVWNRPG